MAEYIDENQVSVADIIVNSSRSTPAIGIEYATASEFAHAALCTMPGQLIESISPVVEHSFKDAFRGVTLAFVLRYRGITQRQRNDVVECARRFKGYPYDLTGAVGSGTMVRRGKALAAAACVISVVACVGAAEVIRNNASEANRDTAFFCSELVARAFELAGIPLFDRAATWINPRMVRTCDRLEFVGRLDMSKYQ